MTVEPITSTGAEPHARQAWARAFDNLGREHGPEPLRVEGTIPQELDGTLYRNGVGRMDVGGDRYGHWFDGDGAVTALRLQGGRATGAVKLVRTPGLARQERAGRVLFGGYNTPFKRPLRELFLGDGKNPANTSVQLWQGRLFALCEAGLPFELDRADLATLGERDLGGVLVEAVSAHPHEVPARKASYNFGIAQNGRRATVVAYELPQLGRAREITRFEIRGPTMIHDFAATHRHLVFSIPPMRMALLPILLGRGGAMDAMRWYAKEGTEIVVVPIDDPAGTFRVRVDAHLAEHVVNAHEEGDRLVFDMTRYDEMRSLERHVGKLTAGVVEGPIGSTLSRGVIDLRTRAVRFETQLDAPCELPRVSPRVDARPHRFVYLAGFSSDEASRRGPFDAVLKVDLERGSVERWRGGAAHFNGEAVFVPRRAGTAEDDGYLLTLVYDAASERSHLAILDARRLDAPPLARAHFDQPIPAGFHGQWAPAA